MKMAISQYIFKLDSSLPTKSYEIFNPKTNQWKTSNWTAHEMTGEANDVPANGLNRTDTINNGTSLEDGPKIIVRTEEILIVGFVLILWVGAIVLFFNRWGKIRMLEPYQPKFQQQHRSSCPLVDIESLSPINHRASFSRMSMGVSLQIPPSHFGSMAGGGSSLYAVRASPQMNRTRQNSVFVGPQFVASTSGQRKTRSAIDLSSMVLDEASETV